MLILDPLSRWSASPDLTDQAIRRAPGDKRNRLKLFRTEEKRVVRDRQGVQEKLDNIQRQVREACPLRSGARTRSCSGHMAGVVAVL